MDELLSDLSSSFAVSGENSSHSQQHPRWADFKNEGKVAEKQRSRRQLQIERQNKARDECLNRFRSLCDDSADLDADAGDYQPSQAAEAPLKRDDVAESSAESCMGMESPSSQTSSSIGGGKHMNKFADVLMLSEWLVDIPGELSTEWTMVPCPVGRRCLIVASNGSTKCYAKNGRLLSTFQSALPGGHHKKGHATTMMDCIMVKKSPIWKKQHSHYYVLDLLNWNGQEFTESEFPLRHFFLESKLREIVSEKPRVAFPFTYLPTCPCEKSAMTEFMKQTFDFDRMDGLLFYYNEALYTPGQTPLVGWLKPWMLPEILEVDVPPSYFQGVKGDQLAVEFIEKYNREKNFKSSMRDDDMQDDG